MESGKKLPPHSEELIESANFSAICFIGQKEIFINDLDKEWSDYLTQKRVMIGEIVESVMFLPLVLNNKTIGVITVQSFDKHAYLPYHTSLLRNIAVYAAIALGNAALYAKSEKLLLNILPAQTAEELKQKGFAETKSYRQATVLFSDFKGFTHISEQLSPEELVRKLDECFKAFDRIVKKHGIEKIKTIGDAYMCAGGLPETNQTHPEDAIRAAFEMLDFVEQWNKGMDDGLQWQIRIGIHTGPLVAGVVGENKFSYDVWGDTVNTASRIETAGTPGRVNISGDTYLLVKDKFDCEHRGKIQAKGKGEIDMYFVNN